MNSVCIVNSTSFNRPLLYDFTSKNGIAMSEKCEEWDLIFLTLFSPIRIRCMLEKVHY